MVNVPPVPGFVNLVTFVATEIAPGPVTVSASAIDTLSEKDIGVATSANRFAAVTPLLVELCTR